MTPRRTRAAGFTLIELIARAGAARADVERDLRRAVARRPLLGRRRGQGDAGVGDAPRARIPARGAHRGISAAVEEGGRVSAAVRGRARRAALRRRTADARGRGRSALFPAGARPRRRRTQLVVERLLPDPQATQNPEFQNVEHSVLADGIAELKISYFGRDPGAADSDAPSLARPLGRPPAPPAAGQHRRAAEAGPRLADARRRAAARAGGGLHRLRSRSAAAAWERADARLRLAPGWHCAGRALWLTVLLTVIASGFAFSMHSEALSARNALSVAQARAAADGAVERVAFELGAATQRRPTCGMPDGQVAHVEGRRITTITVSAIDEAARIDLNMATEPLLKGLLQNVGGLDARPRTASLERSRTGAIRTTSRVPTARRRTSTRAAGKKYVPANGPFTTGGRAAASATASPGLAARLADDLTVYSRQPGINPRHRAARRAARHSGHDAGADRHAYIAQRADALANKLPIPPLPQAQAFSPGAAPVWRIRAEATMPDGVTFVRDAVLRPSVRSATARRSRCSGRRARARRRSLRMPTPAPQPPHPTQSWTRQAADLSQRMREAAHRLGLTAFWRWWAAQLAPLVPAAPRAAMKRDGAAPGARVRAGRRRAVGAAHDERHAAIRRGGAHAARGRCRRGARRPGARRSSAAAGRLRRRGRRAKVIVALPRGEILRKQLTLPAAVEQDLKQALAYDLDRHTPFKPDELYFDAAVVARDPQKNEIRVDWAAALRTVVDQARRRRRAGARASSRSRRMHRSARSCDDARARSSTSSRRRAPGGCVVASLAAVGAARAGRVSSRSRDPAAALAEARLHDRAVADHRPGASAGGGRERAPPAARAA